MPELLQDKNQPLLKRVSSASVWMHMGTVYDLDDSGWYYTITIRVVLQSLERQKLGLGCTRPILILIGVHMCNSSYFGSATRVLEI